ncbi:MAG: hypothetical protein R3C97_18935 [Geminicoccaceae bacterium]
MKRLVRRRLVVIGEFSRLRSFGRASSISASSVLRLRTASRTVSRSMAALASNRPGIDDGSRLRLQKPLPGTT